jgi:hypothetical protein
VATKCCTVAPNICGSSVRNLLHITVLVPRILRRLLIFKGLCAPAVIYLIFSTFLCNRRYVSFMQISTGVTNIGLQ